MRHEMDETNVETTTHLSVVHPITNGLKRKAKPQREIGLVSAASMIARRTKWLWDGRIPLGELALLAGREGIGKSTVCYQLVADITRGRLSGEYFGTCRQVIIVATEDSWECTIIPRLLAAGADLEMVFNARVNLDNIETGLSLPDDLVGIEALLNRNESNVAMILLDPLMSRISAELNTHKESDVRQALEPLAKLAHDFSVTILGIIHVNKDHSADAMTSIMGSRAFASVTRAAVFCLIDPEDDTGERRLLGQAKNNLGKMNVPTLAFKIENVEVGIDPEDGRPIESGRVVWLEKTNRILDDFITTSKQSVQDKTATSEAADWLRDYLEDAGEPVLSSEVKKKGKAAGHSESSLKRVLKRLSIVVDNVPVPGKPRLTYWSLPVK
jgi:archaellum biogenesis ATPase FlaH